VVSPDPTTSPDLARGSWRDLVTAAVLGTERHALTDSAVSPERLADALAVRVALRRAARVPDRSVITTAPPRDPRQPASAPAAELLAELLQVGPVDLVEVWLARAAGHGVKPPGEHLAALWTQARHRIGHLDFVRVRWLADQLPELGLRLPRTAPTAQPDEEPADPGQWSALSQLTLAAHHARIARASASALDAISQALMRTTFTAAQLRLADQLHDAVARRRRLDAIWSP
jgi:hypothetical protein